MTHEDWVTFQIGYILRYSSACAHISPHWFQESWCPQSWEDIHMPETVNSQDRKIIFVLPKVMQRVHPICCYTVDSTSLILQICLHPLLKELLRRRVIRTIEQYEQRQSFFRHLLSILEGNLPHQRNTVLVYPGEHACKVFHVGSVDSICFLQKNYFQGGEIRGSVWLGGIWGPRKALRIWEELSQRLSYEGGAMGSMPRCSSQRWAT